MRAHHRPRSIMHTVLMAAACRRQRRPTGGRLVSAGRSDGSPPVECRPLRDYTAGTSWTEERAGSEYRAGFLLSLLGETISIIVN